MPENSDIATNLSRVRERMHEACERSGRTADDVRLIAVSKTKPLELVREAAEAGQTLFGENKVQEGMAKAPEAPGNLEWHLIGPLQKNKIRKALPIFSTIHTVESLENASQIQRIAEEEGMHPRVFLQVNIAEEASKHGFTEQQLQRDLESLLEMDRLEIDGLMVIPPFTPEPEDARPHFARLRELHEKLETESGLHLSELSMGMSHDFEVAIEEGATLVRVGTAIFGARG